MKKKHKRGKEGQKCGMYKNVEWTKMWNGQKCGMVQQRPSNSNILTKL